MSVGEVLVGLKVIQALLEEEPDRKLVLSTTTPTGYRLAREESPEEVSVIYNPVDLPWVVKRALDRIQPQQLILVEAEVWPNLVYQARRRGVGVALVNARLSDRSERRFRKFGGLTGPIFGLLDCVCVQFAPDVERWRELGVERRRIHETGSIKYDGAEVEPPEGQLGEMQDVLRSLGVAPEQAIVLAGSTHAGEEVLIGSACQAVEGEVPGLVYIVVPRHVERTAEIVRDLEGIGLQPVLRTDLVGDTPTELVGGHGKPLCLVVNTTGELRTWYHLATLVVIGKSFLGKGGQNPVEAIMAGKPVVTGPHMGNFKAVMDQLLEVGGVMELAGGEALPDAVIRLLNEPGEARLMVEQGRRAIRRHRGAAVRTIKALRGEG